MNLLYWNLKSNSNLETIISDCITEYEVDIAVFSEYDNVYFDKLKNLLSSQFVLLQSFGGCEKVCVFYKNSIQIALAREQHRYLIAKLYHDNATYLLTGLHLPSNIHCSKSSDRKNIIRKIINDIVEFEQDDIKSTLIIGDMNASPFDDEMIEKDAFNSVLFKEIIRQQENVTFQGDTYRRFYNPIIDYLNETNNHYGSFYYGSGNNCLYWYCYDQLLVRKNLMDNIENFQYLKKVKNCDLLNATKPNAHISDHLPLLVNIKI